MNFGLFQANFENGIVINYKGGKATFDYNVLSIGAIALGLFLIILNFLATLGAAFFVVGVVVYGLTQKSRSKD